MLLFQPEERRIRRKSIPASTAASQSFRCAAGSPTAAPNCLRNTAHSRDTKSSVSEGSVSLQVCNLSAQTKQVLRIGCVLSVCSSTPSCAACSTVRRACTMLSNCLSQTTTFVRPPTTIIRAGLRSYTVHWALVADTCAYASQPLEVKMCVEAAFVSCRASLPGTTARSHCQEPLPGTTGRNHWQEPLPATTGRSHSRKSLPGTTGRNNGQKPLQRTTARLDGKEPLPGTTARNHCQELLPGTTGRNHWQEPLAGTTGRNHCRNHCQKPLARTTVRNRCQQLLAAATARSHCQEPLPGTLPETIAGTTGKNHCQEPLLGTLRFRC